MNILLTPLKHCLRVSVSGIWIAHHQFVLGEQSIYLADQVWISGFLHFGKMGLKKFDSTGYLS
ncbi:hypothetical protein GCM10028795_06990 [Lysobacter olei]